MIYSQSTYNRIIALLLVIAGLVVIVLLALGITEYRQSEAKMRRDTLLLLEQAISEEVRLKMEDVYVSVRMVSDPSVIKEKVKKQTIITQDTTFTKETEVSGDMDKELLKSSQSYLLHLNQLQPDTLQQRFDAKLDENGIKTRSIILVRHEHNAKMSGDTVGYRINYRTPIIQGGVFGEITYQGLLSYSSLAVFRLMPKNVIIVLLILEVLILGVVYYLYVGKRKIRPDKIVKKGRYYYIGETVLDTRKMELGVGKETIKLPKQQFDILLMFLGSDDYALDKSELKERFWSKSTRAKESMMSAINKLRNALKEVDCTFNITTKKWSDFYTLEYIKENINSGVIDH